MRRRPFLALATGSLAGFAGCFAETDPLATESTTDRHRSTAATTTATDTPAQSSTEPVDPDPGLEVELETVDYVVVTYRAASSRGVDPDHVVPESEVPDVLRQALLAALEGGYETETVSDELLAAIDEFRYYHRTSFRPYVRLDGTAYEFDPTVPTFVARLDRKTYEDAPPDRVLERDERRFDSPAVESFVRALGARGPQVPRSEYRTSLVPEPVEAFLDRYDYIQDQVGVSLIVTETVDDEPPYSIEVRELTDEDLWGRPVVDEDAIGEDLREFFLTAIGSEHRAPATLAGRSQYFTDDVPDAYLDIYGDFDTAPYFRVNGTVYAVDPLGANQDRLPVSAAVEELGTSDPDATGRFRLTVTPTVEGTDADVTESSKFTFTGRGALPSVLWITHDGERHLLDSDTYDRDEWRDAPNDPAIDERPVNEVLEILDVDDEIAATYTLPDGLPDGTYESRGYFSVSWDVRNAIDGRMGFYPFRVRMTVGPS